MKALLIDVDFNTGHRPGGITVVKPDGRRQFASSNLVAGSGWQDTAGGKEVRVVVDGDASPYEGVEGIEILDGEEAIDAAVLALQADAEPTYHVWDEGLMRHHLAEKNIALDGYAGKSQQEVYADLYSRNVAGIERSESKPEKAIDMRRTWIDKRPPPRNRSSR